jgi:hypothetical protein
MKPFYTIPLLLVYLSLHAQPFVKVKGSHLEDGAGNTITLNGVNLGGWLLWEGWIWGDGFESETAILKNIAKLTSSGFASAFRDTIHRSFIGRADIQKIAEDGFNCVRVPFNHRMLDNDRDDSTLDFDVLDSVIRWCSTYHIYAVLDMHACPGGQNGLFIADPDHGGLFGNEKNESWTVSLWYRLAIRYAHEPAIAGYDLINEPATGNKRALLALYRRLVDTIRTVDKQHLLIIEGNNFAHDFDLFDRTFDDNQLYSFHFYPWLRGESGRENILRRYSAFAKKISFPLWCGEWGEDSYDNLAAIHHLLDNPDFPFCGSAFWTWKKARSGSHPALNGFDPPEHFNHVLHGTTDPPRAEVLLNEFVRRTKLANTTPDERLLSILTHP